MDMMNKTPHKMMTFSVVSLFFTALFFLSIAEAKVYKWQDEKGQTHYASTPPKSNEKTTIIGKNSLLMQTKPNTNKKTDNNKTLSSTEDKTTFSSKRSKVKRVFCDKKIKNLALLKSNLVVTWIEKGKEIQLSGDSRNDKINALEEDLRDNCDVTNEQKKK